MRGVAVLERLCGGNAGGGGSSGGISLQDDAVLGTLYTQWTIGFDGFTYKRRTSGASVQSQAWITPQTGMGSYEVETTVLSGDVPPGTIGAWLNSGSNWTWGWTNESVEKSCSLQVQIRDATSHTVLKTVTVTLNNSGIQ